MNAITPLVDEDARPAHDDAVAVLGRIGSLEVRLAATQSDVRRAQRLRYHVFFEEQSARPSSAARQSRRDEDEYDGACDHLLVIDRDAGRRASGRQRPQVVGVCRLLRREVAENGPGFYSTREYELDELLERHADKRFLELGRSCVLRSHRDKRTVELLWHGIWTYVLRHRIDVMFGCASFEGTDPTALALPLSFLNRFALSPQEWRVRALPERYVAMDLISKETIDAKAALRALPPLIKGYLRLGATFGDGAVIDREFGTVDVMVMLPVSSLNPNYVGYFGAEAGRHST